MEIRYHGHSTVQLTEGEHSIIIDPFQTNVEQIDVQYVLLTHGHADHIADAVAIAKRNKATIIAVYELATYLSWQGVDVIGMNIGGTVKLPIGDVEIGQAFHSSAVIDHDSKTITYMGMPASFFIHLANGTTIYHAGDTALFSDMKMYGELFNIELAFLPIGDLFTMGPKYAAIAAEWLKAKRVVPIHFNTFPPIAQDVAPFRERLSGKGIEVVELAKGERYAL